MKRWIATLASAVMLVGASPSTPALAAPARFEAENAVLFHATVDSDHAGFSGAGFVNTANEVGSWVEWRMTSPQAGAATIGVRYANGTTASRPMDITINGALAADDRAFPGAGAWTTWTTSVLTLNLVAGANAIRFTSSTASGGPNLDHLDITFPSGGGTPLVTENWQSSTSPYFEKVQGGNSRASSGVSAAGTTDGKALQLQLASLPAPGPGGGAEVDSLQRYLYGTFSAQAKTASCAAQPKAGVVTGIFTYFNDGTDHNGNGMTDNSEIDFEVLCAEPDVIYLTIWTDYRDSDAAHKRVGRGINLRTGQILYTCYFEAFGWANCQPLSGAEASPPSVPAVAGFNSSTGFYEYGFTWTATGVTYWILVNGTKITLWDYRGPSQRIPHLSAYYLHNVWHTNGWSSINDPTAVEQPRSAMSAWIDWSKVTA